MGKSYVGVRNKKEQKEKEMGEVCSCKKECFNKITANERSQIFERFWKLGSHEKQWEFILRHISSQNIKKMQLERKSTRSQTIIYNLPQNVRDKLVVCKKMFLSTLGITEKWVYTAIEKEESVIEDRRGKHLIRPNRMKEATAQGVIDHIKQFPVVDSHYTRKESDRLYLNETLNLSKMYRLYKEWYGEQPDNDPTNLASKSQYEKIFNTKFNYSFFKPKKDLCDTCFIYENADEDRKTQLKDSYDLHVKEKDEVRKLKDNEKANSSQDTISVACFDLEKVLYIPQSEVSRFYYKRKYAVYNFTIYDVLMKKGFCYVWHQEIAKRGAIEISSCLWHYIKHEVVEKGKTEVSFYSDSCAGQNRNRFVFAMFQHASRLFGVDICHRFFEKGHSQSEGDTMHACVERAKKNHVIYTPEQMYCIISNAKVEGDKFSVKEMMQSDFCDFKQLVNKPEVNWFQNDDSQKVFWSRVKEVNIKHTNPDQITYKYSLLAGSESKTLTTNKLSSRRRRRGNNSNTQEVITLIPAYTDLIPVPRPLYNDLMELCSAGAIPSAYHYFYKNLNPQNSAERDQVNDEGDSE